MPGAVEPTVNQSTSQLCADQPQKNFQQESDDTHQLTLEFEEEDSEHNSCCGCCRCKRDRCCKSCQPKVWQVLVGGSWGFLTNAERAIILPTLWLYFKTQWNHATAEKFYAITLGAFSLAQLIMTPLFAYAVYRGFRSKPIVLIANQLEILGNVMYIIGSSPWVVLAGRFVSGIGAGCETIFYADMVRLTSSAERTNYVIALLLPRQLGLIFGPVFTLMMNRLNVHAGNFNLSVYNGPGLLMACLWIVHSIFVLFAYPNLNRFGQVESVNSLATSRSITSRLKQYFYDPLPTNLADPAQDTQLILQEDDMVDTDDDENVEKTEIGRPRTKHKKCSQCKSHCDCIALRPYTAYNLITLFGIIFMAYFCLMSLEAVLPPASVQRLNWSEVEVSYVYLGASVIVILSYLAVAALSKCLLDRTLLLVGLLLALVAYIWASVTWGYEPPLPQHLIIPLAVASVAFHAIGLTIIVSCAESLYSKLSPLHDMDRAQSIVRTVSNVAYFIGPYFGGALAYITYVVFIVMAVLVVVPLLLFVLQYEKFVPMEDEQALPKILPKKSESRSNR